MEREGRDIGRRVATADVDRRTSGGATRDDWLRMVVAGGQVPALEHLPTAAAPQPVDHTPQPDRQTDRQIVKLYLSKCTTLFGIN